MTLAKNTGKKIYTFISFQEIPFIIYLCNPFVTRIFAWVLSWFGVSSLANLLTWLTIYYPIFLLLVYSFIKNKKVLVPDFFILLFGIIFFLGITIAIHPEYEYWFTRPTYGVWDYVLSPVNGIYVYFFVRLLNDPEKIIKDLKISAWFMYVYFAVQLRKALTVGYWVVLDSEGKTAHFSYDLGFGYSVLLYVLVFLYLAITKRKISDIIGAACGIVMILLGGSRGPFLDIALFVCILGLLSFRKSRKKTLIFMAFAVVVVLFFVTYQAFMDWLVSALSQLNISSRTITMFVSGNVTSDNGRSAIWQATINMIKENPFGYGAMGTRHVIYQYHDVGHCHQIFLELLVDFGVFLGALIIVFLLFNAARLLLQEKFEAWRGVFLIFLGSAFQLLLSGTYWHVTAFWACIGIGVCAFKSAGRKRGKVL